MRLRQVALVAADLDPAVAALCDVFGIEVAFRDPGVAVFGLRNAVMPVGDTFLEVVAPMRADTTAGRLLQRRGGDGGYMVIVQTTDLDAQRARVEGLGARVVWSLDLPDARTIHLHPRDVGAAILSLDEMQPPASWRWAGPRWQECVRTDVVVEIAGVELQAADPAALSARWAQILDRPARRAAGADPAITLDGGAIRFIAAADGRGDGVGGVDLRVRDRARLLATAQRRGLSPADNQVVIAGTRFRLV